MSTLVCMATATWRPVRRSCRWYVRENGKTLVLLCILTYSRFSLIVAQFAQRGWSVIINDNLVTNVLSLMSLVIACLTGIVGVALAKAHKSWVAEFPEKQSLSVPFLSSFLIGVLIASILVRAGYV